MAANLKQHIDLCLKAIKLLLEFGRIQLEVETWEVLLCVALGISHVFLQEPSDGSNDASIMAKQLEQVRIVDYLGL